MPFKIELENGKYTFINDNGRVIICRYGDPWKQGDKATLSLLQKVEDMQEEIKRLEKQLENAIFTDIDYKPKPYRTFEID